MQSCRECGSIVARRHRSENERLLYQACFTCRRCNADNRTYRIIFQFLQRYVDCPRCGTVDLSKLRSIDKIDSMTKNPFRHLIRLFGGSLYHCGYCRYQFYDLRPRYVPATSQGGPQSTAHSVKG